jgi:hypothetical protein
LFIAFLQFGCSVSSETEDETAEDNSELEDAFIYVSIDETQSENYELSRLINLNGNIEGFIGEDRILVSDQDYIYIYEIGEEKQTEIEKNVWNITIAPDSEKFIYEQNDGIYLFSDDAEDELIYDTENNTISQLIWDADSQGIFIQLDQDNGEYISIYYNIDSKQTEEVNLLQSDGFYIKDCVLFDGTYLFSIIESNDKLDEEEWIPDFVRFNITDGTMTYITDLPSGSSIELLDIYNYQRTAVYCVENTDINDEGVDEEYTTYQYSLDNYANYTIYLIEDNPSVIRFFENLHYITLTEPEVNNVDFPDEMNISIVDNGQVTIIGNVKDNIPSEFYLSEQGLILFKSGDDTYLIKEK